MAFSFSLFLCCCVCFINANPSVIDINNCLPYGEKYDDGSDCKMLSLPLDVSLSIIENLRAKHIFHFMRSCKFNLHSCQQFIRRLLSSKFCCLLNASSALNIKHLLKIPLIDPIKINVTKMPLYFGRKNVTSSKFIGLEKNTTNAFISFFLQKICRNDHQWKIITFVFNETNICSIRLSEGPFFIDWVMSIEIETLNYKYSDIKAVVQLLLHGKIKSILGDRGTWCLKSKWKAIVSSQFQQDQLHVGKCILMVFCFLAMPFIFATIFIMMY